MSNSSKDESVAGCSPSKTGPAGANVEVKVGAYYLLSMLCANEPRGLPGALISKVSFQRGDEDYPLDDVIIHAHDSSGSPAILEVQVKRSISFTQTDRVFLKVVKQIVKASKKEGFWGGRYELVIAVAKTTTKIELSYQDVITWAREIGDAKTFFDRVERKGVGNDGMRSFVKTFRDNLNKSGTLHNDETVWRLLRRIQILVFDFTAHGSIYEELAIARASTVLGQEERFRAKNLWDSLVALTFETAAVGGDISREDLVGKLGKQKYYLSNRHEYIPVLKIIQEQSDHILDSIKDQIYGVTLMRQEAINAVRVGLETGRYLEIKGNAGVGKSVLLKYFAQQASLESKVIVLSPDRTTPRGWSVMRSELGFSGTASELLVELSGSGGGFLFIDNLDFFSEEQKVTISDLLREVARISNFSVIVTRRLLGEDDDSLEWLPTEAINQLGRAVPVVINELTDTEAQELCRYSSKLRHLLFNNLPAKSVARNLFKLSRLLKLRADALVPTEAEMAHQWWLTADGESKDRRARSRLLKFLGEQSIVSAESIDVSDFPEEVIQKLIDSETIRDLSNDKVTFYHDVLREWAIANILYSTDITKVKSIAPVGLTSVSLRRGVELAGSIFLLNKKYAEWEGALSDATSLSQSLKHSMLLSLVRSGLPIVSYEKLLLSRQGKVLAELIRVVLVVEVTPARNVPIQQQSLEMEGVTDELLNAWVLPNPNVFFPLITWSIKITKDERLPEVVIPDLVRLYRAWCDGMLGAKIPLVEIVVTQFYYWLKEIEDAQDLSFDSRKDPFNGNLGDVSDLEKELREAFLTYCASVPELAKKYLESIKERRLEERLSQKVFKYYGSLARVAPEQLAKFVESSLIPAPLTNNCLDSYGVMKPFNSAFRLIFHPPSLKHQIFLDVLNHSAEHGLQLIRKIINHAMHVSEVRKSYDGFALSFHTTERFFPNKQSYFWSRELVGRDLCVTSALIALRKWLSKRIEDGGSFSEIINIIISESDTSASYLLVAVDLLIEYQPKSLDSALPFLSCPELMSFDLTNIALGEVASPGRNQGFSLYHLLDKYLVPSMSRQREELIRNLKNAQARLGSPQDLADLRDPSFMVLHCLNRLSIDNWFKHSVTMSDGKLKDVPRYSGPQNEKDHFDALTKAQSPSVLDSFMRLVVPSAVERVNRLTNEQIIDAIRWSQKRNAQTGDNDDWLATVSTAMVLVRDGSESLKSQYREWAKRVLKKSLDCPDNGVNCMRDGLLFNPKAIAFCGLFSLYKEVVDEDIILSLLSFSGSSDPAAARGLSYVVKELSGDERLMVSIISCALFASLKPQRRFPVSTDDYHQRVAEKNFINTQFVTKEVRRYIVDGGDHEWPKIPSLDPNIRSTDIQDSLDCPDIVFDHKSASLWLGALKHADSIGSQEWVLGLLREYQKWTMEANGLGKANTERSVDLSSWNESYFTLLACCVEQVDLPSLDLLALDPVCSLPDNQFFEITAIFLNKIDVLYFERGYIQKELSLHIREKLMCRMLNSGAWDRLKNSTDGRVVVEAGAAIGVLFFNEYIFGRSRCYLGSEYSDLLGDFLPNLTCALIDCPSTFLALIALDLLEVHSSPSFLSFSLKVAKKWLETFHDSIEFWVNFGIGRRLSLLLKSIVEKEPKLLLDESTREGVESIASALISLGVYEASNLDALVINSIDAKG